MAELDFSPPKHADVEVVYNQNDSKETTNEDKDKKDTKILKIDLNKSVGDFKSQLGFDLLVVSHYFQLNIILLQNRSMFGVSPTQMRLFYVDHEMSGLTGPELLRFNQKKLYTYSIQDGDQFLIDRK